MNHDFYCPLVDEKCWQGIPESMDRECVLWFGNDKVCLFREALLGKYMESVLGERGLKDDT